MPEYWDSSKLSCAGECPRKFQYRMLEGYQTGEEFDLIFGMHFATGMNTFYEAMARGEARDAALRSSIRKVLEDSYPDKEILGRQPVKNRVNLVRSLVWYFDEYKSDMPVVEVKDSEGQTQPGVELSFKVEVADDLFFCGHMDRVVKDESDQIYVMDQKTTGSTPSPWWFEMFNLNDQMSMYSLMGRRILGSPVQGVIIDAVHITSDYTSFERGMTLRDKDSVEEWLTDMFMLIERFRHYAEVGHYPMNRNACGYYRGCEFRPVCSSHPKMRKGLLKQNFKKRGEWRPEVPR